MSIATCPGLLAAGFFATGFMTMGDSAGGVDVNVGGGVIGAGFGAGS